MADIEAVFAEAEHQMRQPRPTPPGRLGGIYPSEQMVFASAVTVAERLGRSMLEIQPEHLRLFNRWGEADQFSFNLPLVFGNYRDAWSRNKLLALAGRDAAAASLDDEEFARQFGRPPWMEINKTLNEFSLPYEVVAPDLSDRGPVMFQLRKTPTGDFVSFDNLSSGEKVLFQLALSTFQPDEFFLTVRRPKVLLLDEMDASLHPEMVHRWLAAIQHSLVEKQGMYCIITTHSPTTVALAPEQSLFEMVDGRSGLASISKQAALNKLTFGVPTLSIDYSGRRQVFAESDTDAAIYESVYALIKSHIRCERELNFLSTGLRDKDNGEINSGSTIVKATVERLAELGNSSIFGIIDWDGGAVSTDRIKVVAGGERNGIENVLLDPLLVALLLMKERRLPDGLHDIDRFTGAQSLALLDLQRLIDAIQIPLFPEALERVEVEYTGGAKCYVLRAYLEADDHTLEAALAEKFPTLNKWKSRGRGELVKAMIEHVLSEHTHFCPMGLSAVFEAVANAPA
ncbi:AAA family ATPase [Mesorhizobium sp.]|uniref:AAA family ATPase n=1 Tax=Mesorhizobium sp. TaxID=1871066 RepID=UPI0025F8BD40|nr:AAA family ATPase [Mesorhizobium sp.]